MSKRRPWLKGRSGKGYRVLSSGTAGRDKYLAVTIPPGQGFNQGDQVYMKPMRVEGVDGLFLTTIPPAGSKKI